jgi:CheY-like chemotaxis protein
MRKLNCTFETAMDGQQAVNAYLAAQGAFDIIFMDIQMPNKDGMTASTEIRQFEQQKSLKSTLIVAITGLASLEAQQQAAKCGIDSMLTKPVKLKTLEAIIQGHILKLHTAS